MGNRFTAQSVNSFLLEQGCGEVRANFIANFVVTALRSVSVNAEIANQSANEDFTSYRAEVAALNGDGFTVDYTVSKLGPGFFDHRAKVTTPESEYTVTRLTHEAQVSEPVAAPAPVVEEQAPVVTEDAPVTVEEELNTEWTAPVVETINEEIVTQLEDVAKEFVAEVVDEAPAVEVEAPKAKKGKAKKSAE